MLHPHDREPVPASNLLMRAKSLGMPSWWTHKIAAVRV
jgi:hypothetical protein